MPRYLDHAATSPIRPEALAALTEAYQDAGNASSVHGHGQAAKARLADARERIAVRLGAEPIEIILTSGGTESINLALTGGFRARQRDAERPVIVSAEGEHHATLDTLESLAQREGAELRLVPLDADGRIRLDEFERALDDRHRIALVSLIHANNEVGTVQPIRAVTVLAHEAGIPVHVDAVASLGHLTVDATALGADLLSVSAHKIGGPFGVGALVTRRSMELVPLMHGGSQQRGFRPGTIDVPGALGFAAALDAACEPAALALECARLDGLIDELAASITAIDGVTIRGAELGADFEDGGVIARGRAAGNLHFTVEGCQGDSLLFLLDMAGISVSTGSACQAGVQEPSHVLSAMGVPEEHVHGALRITLGWTSTIEDVQALAAALPGVIERARRAGRS